MTTQQTRWSDFFHLLEVNLADVAKYPNAFDRVRTGELHGVLVHDVYPPDVVANVVERLERHDPPFLKTWFPSAFNSFFYGRNLNLTEPGLRSYFRESVVFQQHLASLFPTEYKFGTHLAGVLSCLDNGRPFCAAPGPEPFQNYMLTTFRAHLEGGFIPPHFDNEQAVRPSFDHLVSLIEPRIISFVLAFSVAEQGGELEVFNLISTPLANMLANDDQARPEQPETDKLESVRIRIPPGSMIIVDSGRHLHQVTPVLGATKRWTACSFMARSLAGNEVYCWG